MLQRENAVNWIVGGIFLLIIVVAFGLLQTMLKPQVKVQIGERFLNVRVAADYASRAKGLSGTKSLNENEGMLFIFDTADTWGIWMKDMHYNIDIIWLDNNKKVVDIAQNVSPDTYPESFKPQSSARYVLEAAGGFVARSHVAIGNVATFHGLPE